MWQIIKFIYVFFKFIYRIYKSIYTLFIHYLVKQCGKNLKVVPNIKIIGGDCISIGNNVIIRKHSIIAAQIKYHKQKFRPNIIIEDNVDLGESCFITSISNISIGKGTTTGRLVTITDNAHGTTTLKDMKKYIPDRIVVSKGPVHIGKNVWIGDKVTILPNVTIGDGAIIGANAVVSKDIPPYCIAIGIPAKVIKNLNDE